MKTTHMARVGPVEAMLERGSFEPTSKKESYLRRWVSTGSHVFMEEPLVKCIGLPIMPKSRVALTIMEGADVMEVRRGRSCGQNALSNASWPRLSDIGWEINLSSFRTYDKRNWFRLTEWVP